MMQKLPAREGPKAQASGPFPHEQVTQNAPPDLQEELFARVTSLPHVTVADSLVSVPGARAFRLHPEAAAGPAEAFQAETEFAHLHPPYDGSLHVALPTDQAEVVIDGGWGEPHPVSGYMLVFGPRTTEELEIVWQIVRASYDFASGRQDLDSSGDVQG